MKKITLISFSVILVILVIFIILNNSHNFLALFKKLSFSSFFSKPIQINIEKSEDLLKKDFSSELILENPNIDLFYLASKSNKIIYFEKNKIFIFNRKTNQSEKITQISQNPELVLFPNLSKDIKEILIKNKDDFFIVFLFPTIQQSLSLNNLFLKAFKNSDLKSLETDPKVLQVNYHPLLENSYIIRTKKGIYLYDFLKNKIEMIYFGPSSNFFINNDQLYFIKENGVIIQYSLTQKKELESSFYTFFNQDYSKFNIFFNKDLKKEDFIVIDDNKKAYYFENIHSPTPFFIDDQIKQAFIDKNTVFLLKETDKQKEYLLRIFYPIEQTINKSDILISDLKNYLIKELFLILNFKNELFIYNSKTNQSKTLVNDLKNENFEFDQSLNYLYYLTKEGIKRMSIE